MSCCKYPLLRLLICNEVMKLPVKLNFEYKSRFEYFFPRIAKESNNSLIINIHNYQMYNARSLVKKSLVLRNVDIPQLLSVNLKATLLRMGERRGDNFWNAPTDEPHNAPTSYKLNILRTFLRRLYYHTRSPLHHTMSLTKKGKIVYATVSFLSY